MSRDLNKVADGLADHTMDLKRSWEERYDHTLHISAANIVVQSDGGLRENGEGAAAWIIGLWSKGKYEPLVAHGTYLEAGSTVFLTEAIALDEASTEVQRLLST